MILWTPLALLVGSLMLYFQERRISQTLRETLALVRMSSSLRKEWMEFTLNDRHAADEILALRPYGAENKRTHDLYERAEHFALKAQRSFVPFIAEVEVMPGSTALIYDLCRPTVAGLSAATAYKEKAFDVLGTRSVEERGPGDSESLPMLLQELAVQKFPWLGDTKLEIV